LNAYPVLSRKNFGYAGGAEVEQVFLAKELISRHYEVTYITYDCGFKQTENIDGIHIIKTYEREAAKKMSFVKKSAVLLSSLRQANADIYFYEAGSFGILPLFCRLSGKKFVYRIATDATVLGKSLGGRNTFYKNLVTVYDLKSANAIVAQSLFQQSMLLERLELYSSIIKNGFSLPDVDCEKTKPPMILWVGSLSTVKRAEIFLKLARILPNVHFEIVGGEGDDKSIYNNIKAEAEKIPNLTFHGFVPFHKINDFFREASILVNTSSIEGFPNTFIQAWANYCPVVSLNVDPDGLIRNGQLGFLSGTFDRMVSDITLLVENEDLRMKLGRNGRQYAEKNHDIRQVAKQYVTIFEGL
jgi:glycosyltransferase involved in cell wall biosynthesis